MTAPRQERARARRAERRRQAARVLATILVAVTGGLLVRPVLLLGAALTGEDVALSTALIALGYHAVIFGLALTLRHRTRPI